MRPTSSPWLAQLHNRESYVLSAEKNNADVVIIGAGISGVSTAFHILEHTSLSVTLIDGDKIARGATGHNAGHVVSEFERPIPEILATFGKELTLNAITLMESGWDLLDQTINRTGITDPYDKCTGYNGFISVERTLQEIETHALRAEAGVQDEPILVVADPEIIAQIPEHLLPYITEVPHSRILELLKTNDTRFIGLEITNIGCMNSALFCESLVAWMMKHHGERFAIGEHLPVTAITLQKNSADIHIGERILHAQHVVLCTNGYPAIPVRDNSDASHTHFHTDVEGVVGYMTGYLTDDLLPTSAITYYDPDEFYLTKRHFKIGDGKQQTFISAGGCEKSLPEGKEFDPDADFPKEIEERLRYEIEETYTGVPPNATHAFLWQGLQGYTPNEVRRVGFEPQNHALLYNVGCNGIGILAAIFGAKRIAQLLNGETFPPSIFDPELED